MSLRSLRFACMYSFVAVGLIGMTGCDAVNVNLPSTIVIELPDGTTVEVEEGAGAASLANTAWDFVRSAEAAQSLPFVRVRFGASGELLRFENNRLAQEIFGDELIFDGDKHPTSQAGLDYSATTVGAETADAAGFTFEAKIEAFLVGFSIGTGTATAMGSIDPDDPDTMAGTFTFKTDVTLPIDIPEANINDTFSFVAQRVIE